MNPIEKSKYLDIYKSIMEQVSKKIVYFDLVYTQPLGWVRFIEENKCCNKFYLNIGEPKIKENGNVVFDFDLEQEVDPELEDAQRLYCVCHFEDTFKVFEFEDVIGRGICIQFNNGLPTFSMMRGHGCFELRRSFTLSLDGDILQDNTVSNA